MKKILPFLLIPLLILPARAAMLSEDSFSLSCAAAVLMERESGRVIYAKNPNAELSPASVTKLMTMLLVCEAVDNGALRLEDTVTASASAAAMGGSQIYLEEGERMSVGEMLKCVAVVSANDCAVALGEKLCGSESAFVRRMNERAAELGLEHTRFANATGLSSAEPHYSSALDLAVLSRELLSHSWIRNYSTIWTDTIRDGAFGLSNTNKLLRQLDGCTGLKTGFTNEAMFCLAASAEREGVEYIAVILHGDSSAQRFAAARELLEYAFANYTKVSLLPEEPLKRLQVTLGEQESVQLLPGGATETLVERSAVQSLQRLTELPESVEAPVEQGAELGRVLLKKGDEVIAALPLVAECGVERHSYALVLRELISSLLYLKS
ncbi:MAG: D-alanyl-D-alanine carboxypeptidase [Oscillospiraceae bacterium]|nr:D-alanyl-D-alanine carboxypeptidase [Oscillospiraceae bacterium]